MNRLCPLLEPKDVVLNSTTIFLYCTPKTPCEDIPTIPGSSLCNLSRLSSLKHVKGLLDRLDAEGKTIVCYQDKGIDTAAQVWWLLAVLGVENVQVLDGGINAYKSTGHVIQVLSLPDPQILPNNTEIDRRKYKIDTEMHTLLRSSVRNFQLLDTEGSYGGATYCPASLMISEDGTMGEEESIKLVLAGLGVRYEAQTSTIVLGRSAPQLLLALSLLGMVHLCLGIVDRSHVDYFLDAPISERSELHSSIRTEFFSLSGNTEFFDAMDDEPAGEEGGKQTEVRDRLVATRKVAGMRDDRRLDELRERNKGKADTQHSCGGCQIC